MKPKPEVVTASRGIGYETGTDYYKEIPRHLSRLQLSNLPLLLLAEDEPIIGEVIETYLTDAGFGVILVGTGDEAIAQLEAEPERFAGLITDIRLVGERDGWAVARRARELIPDFPVVYMTGDSAVDWTSHGVPHSVVIEKPFAPAQAVTAISSLLNTN